MLTAVERLRAALENGLTMERLGNARTFRNIGKQNKIIQIIVSSRRRLGDKTMHFSGSEVVRTRTRTASFWPQYNRKSGSWKRPVHSARLFLISMLTLLPFDKHPVGSIRTTCSEKRDTWFWGSLLRPISWNTTCLGVETYVNDIPSTSTAGTAVGLTKATVKLERQHMPLSALFITCLGLCVESVTEGCQAGFVATHLLTISWLC